MGEGGLEVNPSPIFLTVVEKLDNDCAYYMASGMSYQEYWEGDPEAVKHYRASQKIKVKEENARAWWQGYYVYEALLRVAPALVFGSKSQPKPYLDKPHEVALDNQDKESQAQKQFQEQMNKFRRSIDAVNEQLKKSSGGEDILTK